MSLAAAAMLSMLAWPRELPQAAGPERLPDAPILLVERRGSLGIEAIPLAQVEASREGLAWTIDEGDRPQRVRWDRVRDLRIAGDGGRTESVDEACPEFAAAIGDDWSIGRRLWRGVARLDRGDAAGAIAALEPLGNALAEESSLRARLVAACLLQARLAGDSDPIAVADAALRCVRLEAASIDGEHAAWAEEGEAAIGGSRRSGHSGVRVVDGWPADAVPLPSPGLAREEIVARLDPRGVAWRPLLAASLASLLADTMPPPIAEESRLPALWRTLLEIRRSDLATLLQRREEWLARADAAELPAIHAHLGIRLLAEASPALRRRGLLEWLAIPARTDDPESPTVRWAWRRIAEAAAAEGLDTLAAHAAARIDSHAPAAADAARRSP